jgi:hypothetical protein
MAESTNVNFGTLIDVVDAHATTYEEALKDLENSANSSQGTNGQSAGQVSITKATVATTKVQLTQSLTEMASGIAKNAADHTKGLGRKIGGG